MKLLLAACCATLTLAAPVAFAQEGGGYHRFRVLNHSPETIVVTIANQGPTGQIRSMGDGEIRSLFFANPTMFMGSSKAYYAVRMATLSGQVICQPNVSARVFFMGNTECKLDGGSLGGRCVLHSAMSPQGNGMCEFDFVLR